jgi:hypothetical protein
MRHLKAMPRKHFGSYRPYAHAIRQKFLDLRLMRRKFGLKRFSSLRNNFFNFHGRIVTTFLPNVNKVVVTKGQKGAIH